MHEWEWTEYVSQRWECKSWGRERGGKRWAVDQHALGVLTAVFHETTSHSPAVSAAETAHFDGSLTCPSYRSSSTSAGGGGFWDCTRCLKAAGSSECGFCASGAGKFLPARAWSPGVQNTVRDACHGEGQLWYTRGCPSRYGWLALLG